MYNIILFRIFFYFQSASSSHIWNTINIIVIW